MKSTKKFYVVGGSDWGASGVWRGYGCRQVNELSQADIVILTGGQDISSDLYGEERHKFTTRPNNKRDELEMNAYYSAVDQGKCVFGICRGAQLIHALNGNKLWQNVDNHVSSGHEVRDLVTGKTHFVSSCHHQMMRVDEHPRGNEEYEVIAVAAESTCREGFDSGMKSDNYFTNDIEVLWYPRLRSLCYQSHPEFGILTDTLYAKELQIRYGFLDNDDGTVPAVPKIATPPENVLISRLAERMQHARMHAH